MNKNQVTTDVTQRNELLQQLTDDLLEELDLDMLSREELDSKAQYLVSTQGEYGITALELIETLAIRLHRLLLNALDPYVEDEVQEMFNGLRHGIELRVDPSVRRRDAVMQVMELDEHVGYLGDFIEAEADMVLGLYPVHPSYLRARDTAGHFTRA